MNSKSTQLHEIVKGGRSDQPQARIAGCLLSSEEDQRARENKDEVFKRPD